MISFITFLLFFLCPFLFLWFLFSYFFLCPFLSFFYVFYGVLCIIFLRSDPHFPLSFMVSFVFFSLSYLLRFLSFFIYVNFYMIYLLHVFFF